MYIRSYLTFILSTKSDRISSFVCHSVRLFMFQSSGVKSPYGSRQN